jgi:hypothetical protein
MAASVDQRDRDVFRADYVETIIIAEAIYDHTEILMPHGLVVVAHQRVLTSMKALLSRGTWQ